MTSQPALTLRAGPAAALSMLSHPPRRERTLRRTCRPAFPTMCMRKQIPQCRWLCPFCLAADPARDSSGAEVPAGAGPLPRALAALCRRRGELLARPWPERGAAGAEPAGTEHRELLLAAPRAALLVLLRSLCCCPAAPGSGSDFAFSRTSWGMTWESIRLPVCFFFGRWSQIRLIKLHSRRCSLLYNLLYFCAFSSWEHQIRQEVVHITYKTLGRATQNNLSGLAPENTEWFPLSLWAGKLACLSLPWLLYCVECYGDGTVLNPFIKIMALWLIFVHRVSLLYLAWV